MKREERKIYTKCIAIMAVYIIAGVWFYTMPCNAEICPIDGLEESDGKIIEETPIVAETGQIRSNSPMSAMPCEDPEAFERWLETYEQETKEKNTAKSLVAQEAQIVLAIQHDLDEEERKDQTDTENEAQTETDCENQNGKGEEESAETYGITIYSFGDEMIEPYLQVMLYEALDRHGISYWYEIALCEMWQESHGDIYAVNPRNGEDMGVMQYKIRYWSWDLGDIFDPAVQLELYATQMANRLNQGLSVDECISRHKTSDYYTAVDWGYVQDVRQHLPNLRKVGS